MAEWNISHTMAHRILTDNESNMIAAFKQHQLDDSENLEDDSAADWRGKQESWTY